MFILYIVMFNRKFSNKISIPTHINIIRINTKSILKQRYKFGTIK